MESYQIGVVRCFRRKNLILLHNLQNSTNLIYRLFDQNDSRPGNVFYNTNDPGNRMELMLKEIIGQDIFIA